MNGLPFLPRALAIWAGLGLTQRILLGVAAVALVGGSFLFAGFGRGPDFAAAFTGLNDQDELAVVTKLKEAKVPYQLSGNGTVSVPSAQVNDVQVMMAGLGLGGKPTTGQGLDMFSQPSFGLTDFAQKVNYQRGLEDDLAKSIQQLNSVQSARVHLALPDNSLFSAQQQDPTASVIVQLRPGMHLDAAQVHAISALVSGSVPSLKPENLSVVDTNGNTLTDNQSGPVGSSSSELQFQRDIETTTAQSLQGLLDRVLGSGRAVVQVSADVNWDSSEQTMENYQPTPNSQPVVSAKHEISETDQPGASAQTGGVPGAASNGASVPSYQAAPNGANAGGATKSDVQTTYQVSKATTKTTHTGGTLKRLNVSVLLDQTSIDPSQVDAIKQALGTAAGIDTDGRGDQITVLAMPFNKDQVIQQQQVVQQQQQEDQVLTYVRLGLLALGPILLVIALWLLLGRGGSGSGSGSKSGSPAGAVGSAAPRPADRKAPTAPVVAQASAVVDNYLNRQAPGAITQDPRKVYLQEQINLLAQSNPSTVASLIQTWIDEDER